MKWTVNILYGLSYERSIAIMHALSYIIFMFDSLYNLSYQRSIVLQLNVLDGLVVSTMSCQN